MSLAKLEGSPTAASPGRANERNASATVAEEPSPVRGTGRGSLP